MGMPQNLKRSNKKFSSYSAKEGGKTGKVEEEGTQVERKLGGEDFAV